MIRADKQPLYLSDDHSRSYLPIDPEASWKQAWDILIMIFLMYTVLGLPFLPLLAPTRPPTLVPHPQPTSSARLALSPPESGASAPGYRGAHDPQGAADVLGPVLARLRHGLARVRHLRGHVALRLFTPLVPTTC
jgi:hypothetical protein